MMDRFQVTKANKEKKNVDANLIKISKTYMRKTIK